MVARVYWMYFSLSVGFRVMQQAHLLAHKLGIIDDEYDSQTHSFPACLLGRKVEISESGVRTLIAGLRRVGQTSIKGMARR